MTTKTATVGDRMPPASGPQGGYAERLDELEARVARLEQLSGMATRADRRSQQEIDDAILSRTPNSYAEAIAYQAAKDRQSTRAQG